ncbi:uncharacterized protein LOC121410955 [Lytechinus variegatus]|uniref:uncharacterized protein LOC121410955 n=1 Tax=Lytechinus variegatus TaxID=7654 RepID=UPI001BB1AECC|nr:uncharacterized protein LOC121410955 [Lytechinus variegatus]
MKDSEKVEPAGSCTKRKTGEPAGPSQKKKLSVDPAGSGIVSRDHAVSGSSAGASGAPGTTAAATATAAAKGGSSSSPGTASTGSAEPGMKKTKNISLVSRMGKLEEELKRSREERIEIKSMLETLCSQSQTKPQTQSDKQKSRFRPGGAGSARTHRFERDHTRDYDPEEYDYGDVYEHADYGEHDYDYDRSTQMDVDIEMGYPDSPTYASSETMQPVDTAPDQQVEVAKKRRLTKHVTDANTLQTDEGQEEIGFASRFAVSAEVGDVLGSEHARSVDFLLTHPLEEKYLAGTCEKYMRPANSTHLLVPRVNPLVWDNLRPHARTLDMKIQRCQRPLVKGITALMNSLKDVPELNETQQDAVALLGNAHFELNQLRKNFIKPELHPRYTYLCKPSVKTTQWLFGDELSRTIKEMDEEQKAVGVMRKHRYRTNPSQGPVAAGGFARPFAKPYAKPSQRYQDAGWVSSSSSSLGHQPFLGGRQGQFAAPFQQAPTRGHRPMKPKRGKPASTYPNPERR